MSQFDKMLSVMATYNAAREALRFTGITEPKENVFSVIQEDLSIKLVRGERMCIQGVDVFLHIGVVSSDHGDYEEYRISHLRSGTLMFYDLSMEAVLKKAERILKDKASLKITFDKYDEYTKVVPLNT